MGKEHVTLSSVDRALSKKILEQRFGAFERQENALDQVMNSPGMLGRVLSSCQNWQQVHETLEQFDLKLKHRGQGLHQGEL
ncbi:MAG: hypothetical protein HRT36_02440 [Alphaproteobacteria bacterium]|nr:hypothetical protein [Alphaproteobacteria bacterium]